MNGILQITTDGTVAGTSISVDGEPLDGVEAISLLVDAAESPLATITMRHMDMAGQMGDSV